MGGGARTWGEVRPFSTRRFGHGLNCVPMSSQGSLAAPVGSRPPSGGMPAASAAASRYRPLLVLGHGGMGTVEAAAEELPDGTTRVVALKRLLRTSGTEAPRVEMFLREARLTTLLEHPNVVRSLAYGESEGEVYLAMEYVAGEPLSSLIAAAARRGEHLPLPIVAFILAEACEGLHAAHELRGEDGELLGVVHRDVSPHNVMVGYDGAVKLLDFGIAKVDLVDCAARTKTGEVKGKTAYMSPEQAMGDPIDRRSDLYSVGAMLFECVTGRRMWGAGTDLDVLRRLALESPPPLDVAAPEAPPELAALYARLVERDPAKRPSTSHELASQLRAYATSSDARVDAEAVRGLMARLFDDERRQREEAIASGLSGATETDAAAAAGESGPVFVTHHHERDTRRVSRRPRLVTYGAALALACAAAGALVLQRGGAASPGAPPPASNATHHGAAVTEAPPPATAASEAVRAATVPTLPVAARRPAPAPSAAAASAGSPTAPRPPAGASGPRVLATPTPSPAPPTTVSSATPAATPPRPAAPEPLDVDPNPF